MKSGEPLCPACRAAGVAQAGSLPWGDRRCLGAVLSTRLRRSLRPTPEGQPTQQTARGWRGLLTVSGLALRVWGGAAVLALASLGAAAGIVPSDFIIAGRVYTYIDYPNSAAALFASAFLLGLGVRGARPAGGGAGRFC